MEGKVKIFVSAYACEPGFGSEIGVGWHWVLEMSKGFDLWVLTRESNRCTIEPWIEEHPEYARIRFVYFDLPGWARFWKKGLRGVRTYYNIWQYRSNKIVRRTMRENGIEVFHHLTYGNFLWPVSRYGRKRFFIWGPGSAGSVVPEEFSREYCLKGRLKESLQRFARKTLRCNRGFKKRCRDSDLILCKTTDTLACIPPADAGKAVLFTDVAVEVKDFKRGGPPSAGPLKFIAVGTLDGWRGFDILIEAFSLARRTYPDLELEILGEGCERKRLEAIVERLGLAGTVTLPGKVSTDVYYEKMMAADVVVNPCLREGAVTTAFDSMSLGKPLLCIETGGYTRYFDNDHAVVIRLAGRRKTVEDMARGMIALTDAGVRNSKGTKAREAAAGYTWGQKGLEICEVISTAYKNGRSRK